MKRLIVIGLIALALFAAVPATAVTSNNLYQVLQGDGSFSKLVLLLGGTHQDTSLIVAGPFTVLAPTDDAFNKLPAASASSISADRFKRNSVMRNHMIAGKFTTDQLVSMGTVGTLGGQRLKVTRASDGTVTIGGAKIVKPNIEARNGIIQGIDGVLVPS